MGCSLKTPFKKDNHFMKSVPNYAMLYIIFQETAFCNQDCTITGNS